MPPGRKKPAPQPLSLSDPGKTTRIHQRDDNVSTDLNTTTSTTSTASGLSPAESRSPASTGTSPSLRSKFTPKKRPQTAKAAQITTHTIDKDHPVQRRRPSQPTNFDVRNQPPPEASPSAPLHTVQTQPKSPPLRHPPNESRKPKGGLFHFSKPSRSHNHFPTTSPQRPSTREQQSHAVAKEPVSTVRSGGFTVDNSEGQPLHHSPSDFSLSSGGDRDAIAASPASAPASAQSSGRKGKQQKPFGLLTRNKSFRDKEAHGPKASSLEPMPTGSRDTGSNSPPLSTPPGQYERGFRDGLDSNLRARSEDRTHHREDSRSREGPRERDERGRATPPPANRDHGGSTFLSGLRSSSTRAAMFGKGFFGKSARSGSANEKIHLGIDDEHYELKVINLPLVEQTRRTRISKRLEDSRDKTEFWMPAFPWRAIDYLNYKGCEVEGLYRVPGSGPQIKKWQRKFDEHYDVNLFEERDLYDINIIGSMLKAWLRELPDELFPKTAQERISRECAGSETVPQMLIDELSNLSPFQYYLLFAITCHLSLLLAHSDKNKMDFRNLCICFQPCMKIDAFCFKFLVCDWRECWKGCKNEAAYIEQEYILLDQPPPITVTEHGQAPSHGKQQQKQPQDEGRLREEQRSRPTSSRSNSTTPSYHSAEDQQPVQPASPLRRPSPSREMQRREIPDLGEEPTTTTLTVPGNREPLHQLSPIAPLSPLGFK